MQLAEALWGEGQLAVHIEAADPAPIPLRSRIRSRLELSGWLSPVAREQAGWVWQVATNGRATLGEGDRVARLVVAEVRLADPADAAPVGVAVEDYLVAEPDPLADVEVDYLGHLPAPTPRRCRR
jgi:hypothetical protein